MIVQIDSIPCIGGACYITRTISNNEYVSEYNIITIIS